MYQPYAQPQPYVVSQPQPMVIQQQPRMGPQGGFPVETEWSMLPQPTGGREWSSGICDCTDDLSSCCLTMFCGGFYVCYLSGIMGEGCCMPCWTPESIVALRTKLRTQGRIEGSILEDCCCSTFCAHCVVCQLKRELDYMSGRVR